MARYYENGYLVREIFYSTTDREGEKAEPHIRMEIEKDGPKLIYLNLKEYRLMAPSIGKCLNLDESVLFWNGTEDIDRIRRSLERRFLPLEIVNMFKKRKESKQENYERPFETTAGFRKKS